MNCSNSSGAFLPSSSRTSGSGTPKSFMFFNVAFALIVCNFSAYISLRDCFSNLSAEALAFFCVADFFSRGIEAARSLNSGTGDAANWRSTAFTPLASRIFKKSKSLTGSVRFISSARATSFLAFLTSNASNSLRFSLVKSIGSISLPKAPKMREGTLYLYSGPLFIRSKSYCVHFPVSTKSSKLLCKEFAAYA